MKKITALLILIIPVFIYAQYNISYFSNDISEAIKFKRIFSITIGSNASNILDYDFSELIDLKKICIDSLYPYDENSFNDSEQIIKILENLHGDTINFRSIINEPHTIIPAIIRIISKYSDMSNKFFNISENSRMFGSLYNLKTLTITCFESNPKDIIKYCSNIVTLDSLTFYIADLTHLPEEIGELSNLKSFSYIYNDSTLNFKHGINILKKLPHLNSLSFEVNRFDSVPNEIGELTNLEYLELVSCEIEYISPKISKLTKLKSLNLLYNFIDVYPPEFWQLTSLEELRIDFLLRYIENYYNITKFKCLKVLELSLYKTNRIDIRRKWIRFFNQLKKLKELKELHINGYYRDNPFSFQIFLNKGNDIFMNQISKLKNLEILSIDFPIIDFPDNFHKLKKLKVLSIELEKEFPDELLKMTSLEELNLVLYEIDTIPIGIANLVNLKILRLWYDPIFSFPSQIVNLPQLEILDLSNNEIDSLPESIENLTSLKTLILINNPISEEEQKRIQQLLPNTEIVW